MDMWGFMGYPLMSSFVSQRGYNWNKFCHIFRMPAIVSTAGKNSCKSKIEEHEVTVMYWSYIDVDSEPMYVFYLFSGILEPVRSQYGPNCVHVFYVFSTMD